MSRSLSTVLKTIFFLNQRADRLAQSKRDIDQNEAMTLKNVAQLLQTGNFEDAKKLYSTLSDESQMNMPFEVIDFFDLPLM